MTIYFCTILSREISLNSGTFLPLTLIHNELQDKQICHERKIKNLLTK